MSGTPRVCVVGAGIVGLSVAYELRRLGAAVTVLERDRVACGATRAAAGMLAPISEAEVAEPELVAFGRDSVARYREWVDGVERDSQRTCGLVERETLWVAVRPEHVAEIGALERRLRARGHEATWLDAAEASAREPFLSPRVSGAVLLTGEAWIRPADFAVALAAALRARDAEVVEGFEVSVIERRQGRVVGVSGPAGRRECDCVVLASGVWTGPEGPALRPVRGQLVRLRATGAQGALTSRMLRSPDVYLVPQQPDELWIGGTSEEKGMDTRAAAGAVRELLRAAWEILPGVDELEWLETVTGLRPAFDDQLPAIGEADPGVFWSLGHYRHGVLLAPATAYHLARAIVEKRQPPELRPFDPARLRGVRT